MMLFGSFSMIQKVEEQKMWLREKKKNRFPFSSYVLMFILSKCFLAPRMLFHGIKSNET